jgi:hypothetical protein
LRNFDQRRSEAETVADSDIVFIETGGRNVFAESTRRTKPMIVANVLAPDSVVIVRIVMQRLLRSAMHFAVALLVAIETDQRHAGLAGNRALVDRARRITWTEWSDLACKQCVDTGFHIIH